MFIKKERRETTRLNKRNRRRQKCPGGIDAVIQNIKTEKTVVEKILERHNTRPFLKPAKIVMYEQRLAELMNIVLPKFGVFPVCD